MLLDISRPVAFGAATWPGDPRFELRWASEIRHGAAANVASLHLGAHTGTHVDAFLHVGDGLDAASMPLDAFVGPCVVVDARASRGAVDARAVDGVDLAGARVLLRTAESTDPWRFVPDFTPLEPELAERLVRAGARLVGTDAPSVDAFGADDLVVHRALARGGVAILENLVLDHVPPGPYDLSAAPLKLVGADGSPVRALLRTLGGDAAPPHPR